MNHPLLTSDTMSLKGQELLKKIRSDFIGLDTKYKTADGKISRRIYLDTTASSLMMGTDSTIVSKSLLFTKDLMISSC